MLVGRLFILLLLGAPLIGLSGCRWRMPRPDLVVEDNVIAAENPVWVPYIDRYLVMDQVSDELDDYFRIKSEQRIRLVDGILTEGWVETHPQIGSSVLEPWRRDSLPGKEKLHSTLQTVRRFAKIRVIPVESGYSIDVKVFKELEDLPQPEHSTVNAADLRHDNALDIFDDTAYDGPVTAGWIPLGRDFALEQKILVNLRNRIDIACQQQ